MLILSGAWLGGLSSVPQGSGLSRLRSSSIALVNVLAAGINNPFALLDIANCTHHLAKGGKKDSRHIANIVMPLINYQADGVQA